MLDKETIHIPDYSYEYIFEEEFEQPGKRVVFCKGMRFKIQKIVYSEVTIELISTIEECSPAIEKFASSVVEYYKNELSKLEKLPLPPHRKGSPEIRLYKRKLIENIEQYETLNQETRESIYKTYLSNGWLSKCTIDISTLNKGKFKIYNK